MALIGLKQFASNVKNAYVDVTGDTDTITYGNLPQKISNINVGSQADWDELDETQASYIKNKPFSVAKKENENFVLVCTGESEVEAAQGEISVELYEETGKIYQGTAELSGTSQPVELFAVQQEMGELFKNPVTIIKGVEGYDEETHEPYGEDLIYLGVNIVDGVLVEQEGYYLYLNVSQLTLTIYDLPNYTLDIVKLLDPQYIDLEALKQSLGDEEYYQHIHYDNINDPVSSFEEGSITLAPSDILSEDFKIYAKPLSDMAPYIVSTDNTGTTELDINFYVVVNVDTATHSFQLSRDIFGFHAYSQKFYYSEDVYLRDEAMVAFSSISSDRKTFKMFRLMNSMSIDTFLLPTNKYSKYCITLSGRCPYDYRGYTAAYPNPEMSFLIAKSSFYRGDFGEKMQIMSYTYNGDGVRDWLADDGYSSYVHLTDFLRASCKPTDLYEFRAVYYNANITMEFIGEKILLTVDAFTYPISPDFNNPINHFPSHKYFEPVYKSTYVIESQFPEEVKATEANMIGIGSPLWHDTDITIRGVK